MAAKYRKVDPRIWRDEGFSELNPNEKLIAMYAITAQSNRCGLFSFSIGLAAEECGMASDSYTHSYTHSFAEAFGKVCHTLGWSYDERRKVLYLPTWWKYNPPENPNHLKGCLSDLHELPQTELFAEFAQNDKYLSESAKTVLRKVCDSYGYSYAIAMPHQKQEQKQEQKSTADAESPPKKPKTQRADKPLPIHRELTDHFVSRWKAKYGRPYPFRKVDGVKAAELLKATGGCVEDAKAVLDAYLADDDGFLNGHSLTLLLGASQLPRFMAKARGAKAPRTGAYQQREDN